MKSSKVFVLPSTREGFGIVVLEANASGLPVVAIEHDKNAACDLIHNRENGFKGELSEEFIMEKINLILKNDELWNRMHNNAIEYSKQYNWDMIVKVIEKTYNKMSKRKQYEYIAYTS